MRPIQRIRLPGRGAGRNAPTGYLVGRVSTGRGPLELLDEAGLRQVGVATSKSVAAQAALCGFRFYVGGRPAANEEIGSGLWTHDVQFFGGQAASVTALTSAASSAVWNIKLLQSGVYVAVGTITFAPGSSSGVVAWTSTTTVPAGTPLSLWAPAVQDATLASITGTIYGSAA